MAQNVVPAGAASRRKAGDLGDVLKLAGKGDDPGVNETWTWIWLRHRDPVVAPELPSFLPSGNAGRECLAEELCPVSESRLFPPGTVASLREVLLCPADLLFSPSPALLCLESGRQRVGLQGQKEVFFLSLQPHLLLKGGRFNPPGTPC